MQYAPVTRITATSVTFAPCSCFQKNVRHFTSFKIGRKHKAHRQQAQQNKPWRNAEKGRKGKGKRGRMGQDESRVVDPTAPPQTLEARTLEALAQYIKDGRAQKIVVMVSWDAMGRLTAC
jgi:NAD-dependent histone deacetylase SIR2